MPKGLADGFKYDLIHKSPFSQGSLCIIEAVFAEADQRRIVLANVPFGQLGMTSSFSPSAVIGAPIHGASSSNEFGLLCACAGVDLAPDRIAQIAGLDPSKIDWNELLRL